MQVASPLGYLLLVGGAVALLFPKTAFWLVLFGLVRRSLLFRLGSPIVRAVGLFCLVEGGFLLAFGEPLLIEHGIEDPTVLRRYLEQLPGRLPPLPDIVPR